MRTVVDDRDMHRMITEIDVEKARKARSQEVGAVVVEDENFGMRHTVTISEKLYVCLVSLWGCTGI